MDIKKRRMKKAVFYLCMFHFMSISLHAQKSRSYSFFQLLNAGKSKKPAKQFGAEGAGNLVYQDSLLYGRVLITEKEIVLINVSKPIAYNYDDSKVSSIYIGNSKGGISLVRLNDVDNRLWRLIKDTLGIKMYDKNISYPVDGSNIDYASLIFRSNNRTYEAETFWVTSTKRNILKIVNNMLGLKLNPKEFKGKDDLMNQIINNDRKVYSKLQTK